MNRRVELRASRSKTPGYVNRARPARSTLQMGRDREHDRCVVGMRRPAWVFVAIAFGSSVAHAQPPLEVGAFGGPTSSKTLTYTCIDHLLGGPCSPATLEPHYRETGLSFGAYFRLPVHPVVLLEADVLYAQKGENGGPYGTDATFHYLELPLLAEIDPVRSWSRARVFGLAGLSPAIRVGCTADGTIFDNDAHMPVHYAGSCGDMPAPLNKREPKRFDLGLVVGAGVGWKFPFGTLEIQGRYAHGLIDTSDEYGDKTINRSFFLVAGFGMAVGRH